MWVVTFVTYNVGLSVNVKFGYRRFFFLIVTEIEGCKGFHFFFLVRDYGDQNVYESNYCQTEKLTF